MQGPLSSCTCSSADLRRLFIICSLLSTRKKMRSIILLSRHSRNICLNHFLRFSSLTVTIPYQRDQKNPIEKTLEEEDEEGTKSFSKNHAIPKKKHVIQMIYCGSRYSGMQINKTSPLPTIEGEIISALVKAECIPEICATDLKLVRFQRCARTDKGVSALAQVVSVRLFENNVNTVETINSYLPPEIRVIGVKRTTKGFNSKIRCDARTYSYTLPTFALSRDTSSVPDSSFRLSREDFHYVNRLISFYKGTHSFHNFTRDKLPDDPSARRHMYQISCSEPFVRHGVEFARIVITGQSFMLHQIRKMVGLIIAVVKGVVTPEFLPLSMTLKKTNLPLAPALGLVLECTHFESHNRRCYSSHSSRTVTWEEFLPTTEAFREEKIMPVIIDGELTDLSFSNWLQQFSGYTFLVI
ncbi:stAR-related lipid transfer protein 5 isoform X1 [Ranitomeya imitator]|uniref:stAR-related lipid transfer protein 5 isoform X1 n=1 Tax=Ranitomeya imitator TaxID=111125 RepID=UPI0037E7A399